MNYCLTYLHLILRILSKRNEMKGTFIIGEPCYNILRLSIHHLICVCTVYCTLCDVISAVSFENAFWRFNITTATDCTCININEMVTAGYKTNLSVSLKLLNSDGTLVTEVTRYFQENIFLYSVKNRKKE